MKRPSFNQLMAGLLIVERLHSALSDLVPSYYDSTQNFIRKTKKKLGLSHSLLDRIHAFLGTTDVMEDFIETDHSIQDGPMYVYLRKCFEPYKVLHIKSGDDPVQLNNLSDAAAVNALIQSEAGVETLFVRKVIARPSCAAKANEEQGLRPTLITMAHYKERPFVFQIRKNEHGIDEGYTTIDFLFNSDDRAIFDKFTKNLDKFLLATSPLRGWVVSCEQDDSGNFDFLFDEELCKKLRTGSYQFDINLYNEDVRNLLQRDIKNFIDKQEKFCKDGFDGRRAYLLEGPPGTGKSDIIRSIISLLPERYTSIVLNEKNIYELRTLKEKKFLFPAFVVIEDIDLLVTSKSKWQVLLNFLDGIHAPDKIVTIMTSNNRNALISSITNRPGRIDRIIFVGPGTKIQRVAQLNSLTKGIKLPPETSVDIIADKTDGYTVAQLRELIRRSIIYSVGKDDEIDLESINTVMEEFERQQKLEADRPAAPPVFMENDDDDLEF